MEWGSQRAILERHFLTCYLPLAVLLVGVRLGQVHKSLTNNICLYFHFLFLSRAVELALWFVFIMSNLFFTSKFFLQIRRISGTGKALAKADKYQNKR